MQIREIMEILEKYAPLELASSYDNVGLMVGDKTREVTRVLLTLDVDLDVAMEASRLGAELIISHHPLIFNPVRNITADSPAGKCLLYLMENKIAVYSAHTNLDSALGGLNDLAAQFLHLEHTKVLETGCESEIGIGRIGSLPNPMSLKALAHTVKQIYRLPYIRLIGDEDKRIEKVAICTGSGGDLLQDAITKGADAFITGDIKYNVARDAAALNMGMIELGHYESEYIVVDLLEKLLTEYGNGKIALYKSRANQNVFQTIE